MTPLRLDLEHRQRILRRQIDHLRELLARHGDDFDRVEQLERDLKIAEIDAGLLAGQLAAGD